MNRLSDRDPFADRRVVVMIASYCDSELPNTIRSALTQAAYPEHLRFSICHQHNDATKSQLDEWLDDPRMHIDSIPSEASEGCCWARARTFDAYDDEPYMLQIDAHTRFAARWDERYIEMLESIDSERPVLTTYPPPYKLGDDGSVDYDTAVGVQRLLLKDLHPNLTTTQGTHPVASTMAPEASSYLAAGQIFAHGSFCRDVPYDPHFYFEGEEISMAVRAFTNGYDLFCPNENLIWHRYGHDEPLHWKDHDMADKRQQPIARLHTLLLGDAATLGRYGLGQERTVAQFEENAGIDFSAARTQSDEEVSTPQLAPKGSLSFVRDLEIQTEHLDFEGSSYSLFVFALLDADDNELHRADIDNSLVLNGETKTVHIEAHELSETPVSYVLWPVLDDGSFCERRVFPIGETPEPDVPLGVEFSIDRSLLEPRDDYRHFLLTMFAKDGSELARRVLRDPSLLDLSQDTVLVHGVDPSLVASYLIAAVQSNGEIQPLRLQSLPDGVDGELAP